MRTAGLIDLQVNGFAGIDFNSGSVTPAEIDHALEAMLATGVTLLPADHHHRPSGGTRPALPRARRGDLGKPARPADVPGLPSRRARS